VGMEEEYPSARFAKPPKRRTIAQMKYIEDGNFSGWLRIALFVVGLAILAGSLAFDWAPSWLRMAGFFLVSP
jgi:hypothetical protein